MRAPHNEIETVPKNLFSHEISSKFVIAIEFPLLLLYFSCLKISIAEAIREYKGVSSAHVVIIGPIWPLL